MAVQSIAVPSDPQRDARARVLVPQVASWPLFTLKQAWGSFPAGTVFRRAYGSNGARYLVNNVACQCKDYQETNNICKHIRAVVRWEARQQPAPRKTIEDLMPTCQEPGCQNDPARRGERFCESHWLVEAF